MAYHEVCAPTDRARSPAGSNRINLGIDFKNVATVINFDLPTTASSYTHRVGRTARAGKNGMALSFVVPENLYRKHIPTTVKTAEHDERTLARIIRRQKKLGKEVKDYNFNKEQVEAFRYRMNDALRAVTKVAVREARTRELRQELLKSEKLKRYVPSSSSGTRTRKLTRLTIVTGTLRRTRASSITSATTASCGRPGRNRISSMFRTICFPKRARGDSHRRILGLCQ